MFLEARPEKDLLSHVRTREGALFHETGLAGKLAGKPLKVDAVPKMPLSPAPGEGTSFLTPGRLLGIPITTTPDASKVTGQPRGGVGGFTGPYGETESHH